MSWICQGGPRLPITSMPMIILQYSWTDPKTKQIFVEYVKEQNLVQPKKYQDWKRVKTESIDVHSLIKSLKQNKDHFIDLDFPHQNSVLSKDFFKGEIEWKRVRDVIENAVYSKEQTNKTLQKIKLNRKQFQKALIIIARSSPTMFKEILSKTLNSEGVYQFKLFKNGYIKNVVIDDYIPTHAGLPIFVGPARDNQVYSMLLQKAIAKACGSYEQVPENAEQIMEMIFCGPVHTKYVADLREKQLLAKSLHDCLLKKELTVLISKRDPKVRNYGLNDNEVYHLINHHQVELKNTKDDVYELVSESKLSAWNGKYALNDEVWSAVSPAQKNSIYMQVKNNQSFCMSQNDIGKHFEELLVFPNMDINNKDWIQNDSENGFPSFTTFEVKQTQRIFIRVSSLSKIRQTIILVKELSPKKYEFIQSRFEQDNNKTEFSIVLEPAKYVLGAYHEWFFNKGGKYYVFLSSIQHIILRRGGLVDKDFFIKALLSFQEKQPVNQKQQEKLYKIRIQLQGLGLAYLVLNPQKSKTKSIKIDIDQQKLQSQNWQILQPYQKMSVVTVSDKQEQESRLIILTKKHIDFSKKNHFPAAAFKLKESN